MIASWTLAGLTVCLAGLGSTQPEAAPQSTLKPQELTLEKLFRARGYAGQTAREAEFSHDARYLAYLWNPYGENGSDLYVHDTATGQTRRVTSLQIMKAFETPEALERFEKKAAQREKELQEAQAKVEAQAAYLAGAKVDLDQWEKTALEQVKKETADKKAKDEAEKKKVEAEKKTEGETKNGKQEEAKVDAPKADAKAEKEKEKEKELWEWRDELKKKQEKEKLKPTDLYPGVSAFQWAHKASELIFQYRGDLFRYQAASGQVERLTNTDRPERIASYTADDQGYYFMDGASIIQATFGSGRLVQVNRELVFPDDAEKKYSVRGTTLSEDGRWMAIQAVAQPATGPDGAPVPPPRGRQVQIMDYTKRFAESKQVGREVSDDKRTIPATALYIRKVSEAPTRQPEPVFTHPGGDVWFEATELSWAKDGSAYTFATWEREKDLLKVYVGKASETEKPAVVLERKGNVGHEVIGTLAPRFTPDGKTLVVVLDEAGFRQPHALDIATKALRPIVKGAFEAHTLLGFTPDSKRLFLVSNKGDFAAPNVFQVDLASGDMKALGRAGDYHRNPSVSEDGTKVAFSAGNWARRPELHVAPVGGAAKVLTDSHDKAWAQVDALRPERFTYTNRHGDKIEAYAFKPKGWKPSDKRPAIVYTYGGPLGDRHNVEVDSFQPTAYVFGMYMAAKHGYVTVTVDPRGHSNYGRKFSDANFEQPGKPQTEDLEDLMTYMEKGFGVDTKRAGLTGWSFGGFQTQYTMYTNPDLFACGIAGAGPTEWENYNSWYSGRTIGKVDRSKPNLRKYSLIPLAKGLKKPLLLVHGMADPNVLYQDTVNVYRALLESGKEALVDLFLDPEGEHGMGGAVKAKGWHKKYEAYFLQHLGKAK